ncbi:transposase [Collimonas sp. NPDC087041]|uniref:transposase n=1 Tax=Collimonas sp. NPDC087041 TaxID=3363960 RepID=UPI00381A5416
MNSVQEYEMKLRDDQWEVLGPILIGKQGDAGARGQNNRLFIEAVWWVVSKNSNWCNLPPEYGNWNAAYMRFRRWNEANFWRYLAGSRIAEPALALMLSQIADYADRYTQKIREKIYRRNQKAIYKGITNKDQSAIPL